MNARKSKNRIYVLDTSVILHDHNSILSFEEHKVAIPITVLEELDNFKRGSDTKNYEARQFIRLIDKLTEDFELDEWIPLGEGELGSFKIIMNTNGLTVDAEKVFLDKKADHRILNAVLFLKENEKKSDVILVTKDINLRMKAKGLGIIAEDFETGKVKVSDLYTGKKKVNAVDEDIIRKLFQDKNASSDFIENKVANHFYILNSNNSTCLAYYNPFEDNLELVEKTHSYGIKPRNAEQAFAVHALLNPQVRIVTLQGVAGTGKTLLAMATALEQKNIYNQIILARPIVSLSNKDIGYLPGDMANKINPYMEPLWDNLKYISNQYNENEKKRKAIDQMLEEKRITITALAYVRGRTFTDTYFIVDESQNLTPHEIKTIITRAGENTKIVFTGDVMQIDTPFLDEQSNGLSYLIDRFKGQKLFAHIKLEKGERSELANLANQLL